MKKYLFCALAMCLIFIAPLKSQSNWKTFEYPAHNFKISCIQTLESSVDTVPFLDTQLLTFYREASVIDSTHQNSYYSVIYEYYPPDFIHSDSSQYVVEGFINSTQNNLFSDNAFTLLSSSLVEKDGYPGKIFKWKSNPNNVFLEYRIFLIGSRLYQLAVVSRVNENHNKFINQFFDSFQLLNISQGKFKLPVAVNNPTYTIAFPGTPKDDRKLVDSESGKMTLDIQIYEPQGTDDNLVYIAMQTKYTQSVVDQNDKYNLNLYYKKSVDNSLASVSGDLISLTDIYLDNKMGKEFKCYYAQGKALMVYRIFYINDVFYSFGVITIPEKDNNQAMNKFLSSFQLTN